MEVLQGKTWCKAFCSDFSNMSMHICIAAAHISSVEQKNENMVALEKTIG